MPAERDIRLSRGEYLSREKKRNRGKRKLMQRHHKGKKREGCGRGGRWRIEEKGAKRKKELMKKTKTTRQATYKGARQTSAPRAKRVPADARAGRRAIRSEERRRKGGDSERAAIAQARKKVSTTGEVLSREGREGQETRRDRTGVLREN